MSNYRPRSRSALWVQRGEPFLQCHVKCTMCRGCKCFGCLDHENDAAYHECVCWVRNARLGATDSAEAGELHEALVKRCETTRTADGWEQPWSQRTVSMLEETWPALYARPSVWHYAHRCREGGETSLEFRSIVPGLALFDLLVYTRRLCWARNSYWADEIRRVAQLPPETVEAEYALFILSPPE